MGPLVSGSRLSIDSVHNGPFTFSICVDPVQYFETSFCLCVAHSLHPFTLADMAGVATGGEEIGANIVQIVGHCVELYCSNQSMRGKWFISCLW